MTQAVVVTSVVFFPAEPLFLFTKGKDLTAFANKVAALIVGALRGESKQKLQSEFYCPIEGYWKTHVLASEIQEIASGSFRRKEPPQIQGTGYVVKSLEAALWAFHKTEDFQEGCLLAANLGNDADTTAAVYGQLAGACYGESAIPGSWSEKLALRDTIISFADRLLAAQSTDRAADQG